MWPANQTWQGQGGQWGGQHPQQQGYGYYAGQQAQQSYYGQDVSGGYQGHAGGYAAPPQGQGPAPGSYSSQSFMPESSQQQYGWSQQQYAGMQPPLPAEPAQPPLPDQQQPPPWPADQQAQYSASGQANYGAYQPPLPSEPPPEPQQSAGWAAHQYQYHEGQYGAQQAYQQQYATQYQQQYQQQYPQQYEAAHTEYPTHQQQQHAYSGHGQDIQGAAANTNYSNASSQGANWHSAAAPPNTTSAAPANPPTTGTALPHLSVAAVKQSLQAAAAARANEQAAAAAAAQQSYQAAAAAAQQGYHQAQPSYQATAAEVQQQHPQASATLHQPPQAVAPGQQHPPGVQHDPQAIAAVKQSLQALRNVLDATKLMRAPHRASRPPRVLFILRGLPGSGKSYLAKRLREVEVEEGGEAPRIHAIDDYFMTEVEVEVVEDGPRGKPKKRMKTEQQYQYDASMADAYQRSLVKSVCKTLEEGRFSVVVMDAPNMRLEQWQDVLPTAQRHQYAVYVVQPLETDPGLCASRNVHGHTVDHVTSLSATWEEAPSSIALVDAGPLLSGTIQVTSHIDEVDMDDGAGGTQDAAVTGGDGGAVDGEAATAVQPSAALASRWAADDDDNHTTAGAGDDSDGSPRRKRARKWEGGNPVTDSNGLTDSDILKAVEAALENAPNSAPLPTKRILKKAGSLSSVKKRVKWCDEPVVGGDEDEGGEGGGFRIQPRVMPLCEVHVLEDLGPARGDTAVQYMDANSPFISGRYVSFADQVRAEHEHEHEVLAQHHNHLGDDTVLGVGGDDEEGGSARGPGNTQ